MSRREDKTCDEMSQRWTGYARNGTLDDEETELADTKKVMKKDADWIWQQDTYVKTAMTMLADEDRRPLCSDGRSVRNGTGSNKGSVRKGTGSKEGKEEERKEGRKEGTEGKGRKEGRKDGRNFTRNDCGEIQT